MKKPKITKGEWYQHYSIWVQSEEQPKKIVACTANTDVKNDVKEANAKAISAVPEMIDALVEVQHAIDECRIDNGGVVLGDVLEEKVKSAIIKAGCTS